MAIPVEAFLLDPDTRGTLQARIQQLVAEGILSGRFVKGERLPSTRALAKHLSVSRITVTLAYTELQANDYLVSRGRSGFFVSDGAPEPPAFPPRAATDAIDWEAAFCERYAGGPEIEKPRDWASYKYPFIYGQTDPRLFDHSTWRLCALQALGARDFDALTQDHNDRDDPELVEFLMRHTLPRRGIAAGPEEILVTMGAQNALWLAAQVLLGPGRRAVIETPCYPALRTVLQHRGCEVVPVAVDDDGLPPEALTEGTNVVFVTPSHQCPTAATMPMGRRRALLARAREIGALVVEDDYEFEMAFLKPPHPALKSIDREGRVIYAGSFSKSLFPGLRLGYLVGSAPFIQEVRALRASVLRHPPGHVQRTAAHFLRLGHYDALVRRVSKGLHERRSALEAAIAANRLTIAGRGAHGGSSIWMRAPEGIDTGVLAGRLREKSVLIEAGAPFFAEETPPVEFYRLGYSSIAPAQIAPGIGIIAREIAAMGR